MKASQAGLNPYAPNHVMEGSGRPVIDDRAKGFDGDILDQVLKGRWQEGHEKGYIDGHEAARARFVHVFDEGYEAGEQNGQAAGRAQIASAVAGPLGKVRDIVETAPEPVNEEGLELIAEMIETISGVPRPVEQPSEGQEAPAP